MSQPLLPLSNEGGGARDGGRACPTPGCRGVCTLPTYSSLCSPIHLHHQALWMMDPKDISELQHEEFYRYVAQAYDKPRYTLHYRTDAPLNIRSLFYVPETVRHLAQACTALTRYSC